MVNIGQVICLVISTSLVVSSQASCPIANPEFVISSYGPATKAFADIDHEKSFLWPFSPFF